MLYHWTLLNRLHREASEAEEAINRYLETGHTQQRTQGTIGKVEPQGCKVGGKSE